MGHGVGRKLGHSAAVCFLHVVGSGLSFRNTAVGDIGYVEKFVSDCLFRACKFLGECFLLLFENGHFVLCLLGIVLATFFHGFAYAVGHFAQLGGCVVGLKLELAPHIVQGNHSCHRFRAIESFYSQTLHNEMGVGFDLLQC